MRLKKINSLVLSLLILLVLVSNVYASGANASETKDKKIVEINSVRGVVKQKNVKSKIVTSDNDLNFNFKNLKISFLDNTSQISLKVNNDKITISPTFYPSQLGPNSNNVLFGIDDKLQGNYILLKLSIESNTNVNSLLQPYQNMAGKTVMSLGLRNTVTSEIYYCQFSLENFDFANTYDIASKLWDKNKLSFDDLYNREIAAFTLQTLDEFQEGFRSINGQTITSSTGTTYESNGSFSGSADTQGQEIDQLIQMSKTGPVSIYQKSSTGIQVQSLVPDVPDYLYKIQENGTWSTDNNSYIDGSYIGYQVYHMNDSITGNAMNYVMRFYSTARINWPSQQFDNSFNLSHNIWVQYFKHDDSVYIFDNRASNARITVDPQVYIKSEDNGYFTARTQYAHKEGTIFLKIAKAIIGWVPKVSDLYSTYETLTSDTSTKIGSKIYFERNYTKECQIYIKGLKSAPNDNDDPQDYIGLSVEAVNCNKVTYGHSYTCYAD